MSKIKSKLKKKAALMVALSAFLTSTLLSTNVLAYDLTKDKVVYTVATAHLDTQWNWDIRTTINNYIPKTLVNNFNLMEKYPDYKFSFEGAFRYALAKEYFPVQYEQLKKYVATNQWNVTGSSWDAGDVNVPSPEAVMRNILYGNQYFKNEFGKTSTDIFLPDCFGFGYALPSIAAHMGLTGFSTQKLTWGSANGIPFDIGRWYGPDGKYLISALNPGSYSSSITKSVASDSTWVNRVNSNGTNFGVYAAYKYYGTGDTGGSPTDGSVNIVEQDIKNGTNATTGVNVVSAPADQLYKDIAEQGLADKLPSFDGELVAIQHGTGAYTSKTVSKRLNRENELLADATERASVMAEWLGGAPYPKEQLNTAWQRVIWHQFHDDLTGTSIPSAYNFSWNDYVLSLNQFAQELTNGVGTIANDMDTKAVGIPAVVYNPISKARKDVVEAKIVFPNGAPTAVKVYDPNGNEVPSQLGTADSNGTTVLFLADMSSVGYKTYDIRTSSVGSSISTGLSVTASTLENNYYKVTVDSNGDIASVYDKVNQKELLSAPSRLELINDTSTTWPSWEVKYNDLMAAPKAYVSGPADIQIVENGPTRVALKVTRKYDSSSFVQTIRLSAGDDAQRVDVDNNVNWNTKATNLKVSFPLTASNPKATYDLGLGTIQRGNNAANEYEVPAQQWADITDTSGNYGVSILNDCKYGWDKPADNELRLTLIHTPQGSYGANRQDVQDFGENRFLYSIYGHNGNFVDGKTVTQGERVNQPLKAFQTTQHDGSLGKAVSFLSVSDPNVTVKAVKKAEESNEYIIRVQETSGKNISDVVLSMGNGIASAREVNGAENPVGPAALEDGKIKFNINKYEPKTFAVTMKVPSTVVSAPTSTNIDLPYNKDVVSFDANKADGALDTLGNSIPAELLPTNIISGGISFKTGPTADGQNNAVVSSGQEIAIPAASKQVYILAASTAGDLTDTFKVNGKSVEVKIEDYKQNVGGWDNLAAGTYLGIKRDAVAWVATHTHNPNVSTPSSPISAPGNSAYDFDYMFKYRIDLPEGASTITLPNNSNILVFAMTASNNNNEKTTPAGLLYDEKNPAKTYALTVENGSGTGAYPEGTSVSISAAVPSGYMFKEWVGPVADTKVSDTTVNMGTEAVKVTAIFTNLGENLTLNKLATASGYTNTREMPKFGVDGNGKTKWCQSTQSTLPDGTKTDDKWLTIDLGQEYTINRWVVKHAGFGGESTGWNTSDFKLQISSDGAAWTDVDSVAGNKANLTNRWLSNPVTTRYARLYVTKPTNNTDKATRIYEFELYPAAVLTTDKTELNNGRDTAKLAVNSITEDGTVVDLTKASGTTVQYVSDNENVAKVDENGVVTPIDAGTANIIAKVTKDGTTISSNSIKFNVVELSKITISTEDTSFERNATSKINITEALLSDGNAADLTGTNAKVEYISSDLNVVSTENGLITAHNVGTADVYAVVTLDGIKVESNKITVIVTTSSESISRLIDGYVKSEDVVGPLVPQLRNSLTRAKEFHGDNKLDQAINHMNDFIKLLNNPPMDTRISDTAKTILNLDSKALIDIWSKENK